MKVAIVEHLLRVPELEVFAAARECGLDGVELSFGAYDSAERLLLQPGGPARLRERATAAGIDIPSVTANSLHRHPLIDQEGRAAGILKRLTEACAEAAVPVLRVPLYGVNEVRGREGMRSFHDVLEPLATEAAQRNVTLGLDLLLPAEELKHFLDSFPGSAVRLCYDVGNARAAGHDAAAELAQLADRICQVYLKDRAAREPFPSVPLGQGAVDFLSVFRALAEGRYNRWLVLDTPAGDEPFAAARKASEFVRKHLAQPLG